MHWVEVGAIVLCVPVAGLWVWWAYDAWSALYRALFREKDLGPYKDMLGGSCWTSFLAFAIPRLTSAQRWTIFFAGCALTTGVWILATTLAIELPRWRERRRKPK